MGSGVVVRVVSFLGVALLAICQKSLVRRDVDADESLANLEGVRSFSMSAQFMLAPKAIWLDIALGASDLVMVRADVRRFGNGNYFLH